MELPRPILKDAKALVVGIANEHSIAYGCAKAFSTLGADLAITYVNEKTKSYVEPLATELNASVLMPLDVTHPGELEAVFERIRTRSGGVSTSSCTRLRGRRRKTCRAAFSTALQADSRRRWISRAIPSCAWRSLPRRS